MIKAFFVMIGVLFLMIFAVGAHYLSFDGRSIAHDLSSVVALTHMAEPSFSVSYYEPRLSSDGASNIAYPEMMPINRMDFVYEK